MGARPSSFKKGGGFLNNVAAKFVDYEFITEFPGGDGERKSDSDFNPLYATLTFQVDGADEPQTTTVLVGSADEFEIEDDSKSLVPTDGGNIRSSAPFGRFILSAIDGGFPESRLPEDDEPINYEPMLGSRFQLVQKEDTAAMERMAKKAKQSRGKYNEKGQKKGKDGKYYNLTYLAVDTVLALPDENSEPVKNTSAKSSGKLDTKPSGKSNGKSKKDDSDDLNDEAVETLKAILSDSDGKLKQDKIPGKVTIKLGAKHPQRDELRKLIFSNTFLETEQGWSFDAKKGIVELTD